MGEHIEILNPGDIIYYNSTASHGMPQIADALGHLVELEVQGAGGLLFHRVLLLARNPPGQNKTRPKDSFIFETSINIIPAVFRKK